MKVTLQAAAAAAVDRHAAARNGIELFIHVPERNTGATERRTVTPGQKKSNIESKQSASLPQQQLLAQISRELHPTKVSRHPSVRLGPNRVRQPTAERANSITARTTREILAGFSHLDQ